MQQRKERCVEHAGEHAGRNEHADEGDQLQRNVDVVLGAQEQKERRPVGEWHTLGRSPRWARRQQAVAPIEAGKLEVVAGEGTEPDAAETSEEEGSRARHALSNSQTRPRVVRAYRAVPAPPF